MMSSQYLTLSALLCIALAGPLSATQPTEQTPEANSTTVFDPYHAEIVAADGRKITAHIIGHDGKEVRLIPEHVDREYTVPLENLSLETQQAIISNCPTAFLHLDKNWDRENAHAGLDNTTINDLTHLLKQQLTMSFLSVMEFDQTWLYGDLLDQASVIYQGIHYLEPLQVVRDRLYDALEIGKSQVVITDGFPENSFRLWLFPVRAEYRYAQGYDDLEQLSGYNTLGLLVDRSEQIVAVQCIRTSQLSEIPTSHWNLFDANTVDFFGLKKKFAAQAKVRIQPTNPTGVTMNNARPRDINKTSTTVHQTQIYFNSSDGRRLSYSRMYMPDRLARIIAYNIGKNWN
ncbi:hypothetical protein [Ruficoccus sp. ZRK36]|uniref:hypothetical protein n=1 Tax=Ruficoccus sp. ZRK36 TaxID=2866311 RepID=UPI001C73CE68|nr:hypothetical protein [Ruficoccus sp. ZRK36]QYY37122.1 hypothetical protein K0V07_06480 [Ruficoccus sp. ZRK36]